MIVNGVVATTNSVYAIADAVSTPINTAVTGNVLSNDYDPENNSMSVSDTGTHSTPHGSITIASNGSYTYTPTTGYTGDDTYNYTVCDNGTPQACSSAVLTVNGISVGNRG